MPEVEKENRTKAKRAAAEPTNYEYDVDKVKRVRGSGSTKMRLLLLGRFCGLIIGKGGENLGRLRKEHNVDLDMMSGRTDERILSIGGEVDECVALSKELIALCPQAPYPVGQKCEFELNLLISTNTVGMIIGKGGQKLKEIRDESNGRVKVYQECLPNSNERVVAIGGDGEDDVLNALRMVLNVVNESPRTHIIYYDPNNKMSDIMGAGISGSGMVPVMEQGYATHGHGNTGGMVGGMAGGMAGGMGGGNESEPFQQVVTVSTLTIPNEMCGAIIGKAGIRIREIRNTSHAKVEFTPSEKGSTADRVITISGTQHQVNLAEQMMSQCVRNRSV